METFGTPQQKQQLLQAIEDNSKTPGALIPILQSAQEIYGYLPIEVQSMIAKETKIPLANIYGVATFYAQFFLEPKGKYKINVCLGTACYVRGAGKIIERIKERLGIDVGECTADGEFSVDATRCIGACGLAPVLTVNDEVYGRLTLNDLDNLLDKYTNKVSEVTE